MFSTHVVNNDRSGKHVTDARLLTFEQCQQEFPALVKAAGFNSAEEVTGGAMLEYDESETAHRVVVSLDK